MFISHCLGTFPDDETLLEFAKLGVYCQFDLFGIECSLYQLNMEFDMPSDAQRMQKVVTLVKEGYEDRILMSHDIHTKHRLVSFLLFHLTVCIEIFQYLFSYFIYQIDWIWWPWICTYFEQYLTKASFERTNRRSN